MMITLKLPPLPPKSRYFVRGSKNLSKLGEAYIESLKARLPAIKPLEGPLAVEVYLFSPYSKKDSDKLAEVLFNSLKVIGILKDEKQVKSLTVDYLPIPQGHIVVKIKGAGS